MRDDVRVNERGGSDVRKRGEEREMKGDKGKLFELVGVQTL